MPQGSAGGDPPRIKGVKIDRMARPFLLLFESNWGQAGIDEGSGRCPSSSITWSIRPRIKGTLASRNVAARADPPA